MVWESSGSKVPDVVMQDPHKEEWNAIPGMAYEMRHAAEFERPVNDWEARTLVSAFLRQWVIEHPEDEMRYVEVRDLSAGEAISLGLTPGKSYEFTTQFVHHSGSILAAIAIAISTLLIFIAAHAIEIAIIATLIIYIYAMWRLVNYILPDKTYICPKDGQKFDTWENFELHFRTMHSDQEVPPKPGIDFMKLLFFGGLAVIGVITLRLAWPMMTKKKKA